MHLQVFDAAADLYSIGSAFCTSYNISSIGWRYIGIAKRFSSRTWPIKLLLHSIAIYPILTYAALPSDQTYKGIILIE